MLLLHYALMAPAGRRSRAGDLDSCGDGPFRSLERYPSVDWRTRRELHPQPSRRQRGALLLELRVRNTLPGRSLGESWWEALVMLQFVASDFVLRHLIYSQAAGSPP